LITSEDDDKEEDGNISGTADAVNDDDDDWLLSSGYSPSTHQSVDRTSSSPTDATVQLKPNDSNTPVGSQADNEQREEAAKFGSNTLLGSGSQATNTEKDETSILLVMKALAEDCSAVRMAENKGGLCDRESNSESHSGPPWSEHDSGMEKSSVLVTAGTRCNIEVEIIRSAVLVKAKDGAHSKHHEHEQATRENVVVEDDRKEVNEQNTEEEEEDSESQVEPTMKRVNSKSNKECDDNHGDEDDQSEACDLDPEMPAWTLNPGEVEAEDEVMDAKVKVRVMEYSMKVAVAAEGDPRERDERTTDDNDEVIILFLRS
jgi:hypothetical protein